MFPGGGRIIIENRGLRIEDRHLKEGINRRPTLTYADEDLVTAETSLDWARDPEPVEGQRAQRIPFCLSGDDDKQKPFYCGQQPDYNSQGGT